MDLDKLRFFAYLDNRHGTSVCLGPRQHEERDALKVIGKRYVCRPVRMDLRVGNHGTPDDYVHALQVIGLRIRRVSVPKQHLRYLSMTYYSAFCEKPKLASSRRSKRDPAAVRKAMLDEAGPVTAPTSPVRKRFAPDELENIGLPLGKLEDQRWGVSPPLAKAKLHAAGLPYKGRRAELIYSWPSIFRAEGADAELAKNATRETHPHLFDDLVDTAGAAALLGFKDASSIRKLIMGDELTEAAFVRFGTRGVYRFRPTALTALRKTTIVGEIV